MRLKRLIWLGTLFLLFGCTMPAQIEDNGSTITIFAAASLTDAFTEMGTQFEAANPNVQVVFNFAGSQQLAQQLAQGAPGDVFASANEQQMNNVVENGRIHSASPQPFAHNELVVIYPQENPGNMTAVADLAIPGLKIILATAEVPVGAYSLEFLRAASVEAAWGDGFETAVLANVVSYEQNVRAVFSKVALGEADAGIVYGSDLDTETAAQIGALPIPPEWNVSAAYPIAPLADSRQPEMAQAFIDFVLSQEGQQILEMYDFRGK